jgi:peptidoglycan-associated lipoprotein
MKTPSVIKLKEDRKRMKLNLAGMAILTVVLGAALVSCGGSKAVKTTQGTPPTSAVTPGQRAASGSLEKKAPPLTAVSVQKESPESMVALKDVHFDFDRYEIRPSDADILKKDYLWFKENPTTRVMIEGNCDERGSIEYNLALGQRRADAAKDFLLTLGVPAAELKTVSYGKEKPVDPGHNDEAWAKNRRDHLEPEK